MKGDKNTLILELCNLCDTFKFVIVRNFDIEKQLSILPGTLINIQPVKTEKTNLLSASIAYLLRTVTPTRFLAGPDPFPLNHCGSTYLRLSDQYLSVFKKFALVLLKYYNFIG